MHNLNDRLTDATLENQFAQMRLLGTAILLVDKEMRFKAPTSRELRRTLAEKGMPAVMATAAIILGQKLARGQLLPHPIELWMNKLIQKDQTHETATNGEALYSVERLFVCMKDLQRVDDDRPFLVAEDTLILRDKPLEEYSATDLKYALRRDEPKELNAGGVAKDMIRRLKSANRKLAKDMDWLGPDVREEMWPLREILVEAQAKAESAAELPVLIEEIRDLEEELVRKQTFLMELKVQLGLTRRTKKAKTHGLP